MGKITGTIVPDTLNAGSDGTPVTSMIETSDGFIRKKKKKTE